MKVFAGRPRDLGDVRGIIARRGVALDRTIILNELAELEALSDRHEFVDRFRHCEEGSDK